MATKQLRYAHSEGHTEVCFDASGKLISGGTDGDVRVWNDIDDDDPVSHRIGDCVHALACKNERIYAAGSENCLRVHLLKDGMNDGLLLRFTAPITHVLFDKSGSKCYAGSSDFCIKILDIELNSQKLLQGHDAPVLSLALSKNERLLASSSCDGKVKIWECDTGNEIKSLTLLKKCNDFSLAPSICRLAWTNDSKLLIPVGAEIHAYSSKSWQKDFVLKDSSSTSLINVLAVTPCGGYVAAGCVDGTFLLWQLSNQALVANDRHDKKLTITSLAWNPVAGKDEFAFTDSHGYLGTVDGLLPINAQANNSVGGEAMATADDFDDLFADDDDADIIEASGMAGEEGGGEAKAFADDHSDIFQDETSKDSFAPSTSAAAEAVAPPPSPPRSRPSGPPPTPLQPAFQPGAAPVHLSHRFMAYNFVGFIRHYNTEEENSIDVEFHNTDTHHPIHVTNSLNHTMAALSSQALAMACESDDDLPSKLVCMHYGSSDTNKEWSVAMPDGEDVQALCLGESWLAVCTDARQCRIFSVGGLQKQVFSIPGPVVCMTGHMDQLMIVYHKGVGLPGDQNLGVHLMKVDNKKGKTLISGDSLPISHRSTLSWLGFSHEGTPFAMDSLGYMYMLNRKFGNTWTKVCETRYNCRGKSDHNYIVGIQENPPQIRCIACKGARYPPTLPRPVMSIINMQLPLCELSTEKGEMEEAFWRSSLLSSHLSFWAAQGYEVDEDAQQSATLAQQETLIKMFALACKTHREGRAMEIAELLPTQHAVQLAVKYATRMRLLQLATELSLLAQRKAAEEVQGADADEEEQLEELPRIRSVAPSSSRVQQNGNHDDPAASDDDETQDPNADVDMEDVENNEPASDEEEELESRKGPQLKVKAATEKTPKSLSQLNSMGRSNPFKVGGSLNTSSGRGSSVFDSLQKTTPKPSPASAPADKPIKNKKRGFSQATLLGKKKDKAQHPAKENKKISDSFTSDSKPTAGPTAFQLWFESERSALVEEAGDVNDGELAMIAATKYKKLSPEEKEVWQEQSDSLAAGGDEDRKRKRSEEEPEMKKKKPIQKPLSANAKLSAFAFSKD